MGVSGKSRRFLRGCGALLSPPQGLHMADMLAIGCIMTSCFFLFQFGDLVMNTSISYGYLEGHFFDFIRYNMAAFRDIEGFYVEYLQPIFLLLAAWCVPLKLLGLTSHAAQGDFQMSAVELAWAKFLLVIFLALCSVTIYKIARLITERDESAKLCMFLFASNPLTIYVIFIFGGFDIFCLSFMMLGLHAFLQHKRRRFIFWFALGMPFKFFALIPFLPLLLLDEKNMWKILRGLLVVAAPTLACFAFSRLDGDHVPLRVLDRLVVYKLQAGPVMKPALFALAYLVICLFAYFKCPGSNARERQKYAVFLPLASLLVVFVFMAWEIQWIILIAPFLALAFLFSPNRTYSLLFEMVIIVALFLKALILVCPLYEHEDYFSLAGSDFTVFVNPAIWDGLENWGGFLGNFWVRFPAGYDPVRGFFQPGIIMAGKLIRKTILHSVVDVAVLLGLLSPFLLQLMRRRKDPWPTPGLFKTEAGYLRLRCYGGLAAYFLPIAAVSAAYFWFPDTLKILVKWVV